jgi:hypothetical protein
VFWDDLGDQPDVETRVTRSVSEDDSDSVQALVDSIENVVAGTSVSSKLKASSSKRKQLHSMGSLLDGFNERVADLEKSAKARMDSFSEIRCDTACSFMLEIRTKYLYMFYSCLPPQLRSFLFF